MRGKAGRTRIAPPVSRGLAPALTRVIGKKQQLREKSMHTASRRFTVLGSVFCMLLVSGCATKKYARTQAEAVDAKVSAKVTQVETSTRENAERIDAVDKRAQTGITEVRTAAAAADTKATQAQTAATGAQTTASTAEKSATQANQG